MITEREVSGDFSNFSVCISDDDYEPPTEFKNYKEPISLACVFRMLLQTIEGSLVSDKMLAVLCQGNGTTNRKTSFS